MSSGLVTSLHPKAQVPGRRGSTFELVVRVHQHAGEPTCVSSGAFTHLKSQARVLCCSHLDSSRDTSRSLPPTVFTLDVQGLRYRAYIDENYIDENSNRVGLPP